MRSPLDRAIERIETLGKVSDDPNFLVRTFLSPANLEAARLVSDWMAGAGMEVAHTADGTVRGILRGRNPSAPPLLIGSHIDTVIDAGKYDGALGIIAALAAIESLDEAPEQDLHVLAFSDEEGIRFHSTYLGSRCLTGPLDDGTLACLDGAGKAMRQVIADEGWHDEAESICYRAGEVAGYLEVHIEQGRVLEEAGEALAVVSAIAGQARLEVSLTGRTDHAGTTPMPLRRDALTGAAECILAAEKLARENPPLVVTVGNMAIHPGASNSVPQSAIFTVDLRHPEDAKRREFLAMLENECRVIAESRTLHLDWRLVQDDDSVPCDPVLTEALRESMRATTGTERVLFSGAGHDGVALSRVAPIAMLFVRCRDGLSHHPDEFASPEDIGEAIRVLSRFLTTSFSFDS